MGGIDKFRITSAKLLPDEAEVNTFSQPLKNRNIYRSLPSSTRYAYGPGCSSGKYDLSLTRVFKFGRTGNLSR